MAGFREVWCQGEFEGSCGVTTYKVKRVYEYRGRIQNGLRSRWE